MAVRLEGGTRGGGGSAGSGPQALVVILEARVHRIMHNRNLLKVVLLAVLTLNVMSVVVMERDVCVVEAKCAAAGKLEQHTFHNFKLKSYSEIMK